MGKNKKNNEEKERILELTEKLKVPCCISPISGKPKSCGYVEIYLDGTYHNGRLCYVYKRVSNDESYTELMSKAEAINFANTH